MIELQPFTYSDFDNLIEWIDSERALDIWGRWKFTFPLDRQQLKNYLQNVGDGSPFYVFKALREGVHVGHVELNHISYFHRIGTICRILVDPEVRNEGLCEEIVKEALRYGFRSLRLNRIDLQVYHVNEPAIKCYERIGFVSEGRLRQIKRVGNEYWDMIWMSMLADEYAKMKFSK